MKLSSPRRFILLVALALPAGCATAFTGSAHYPGGPRACHADCAKQNMEMSSFVYSGEFATSCVCRPRMKPAAPPPAGQPAPAADREQREVEDAAAIGVVMQQRRAAQQQAAAGSGQQQRPIFRAR